MVLSRLFSRSSRATLFFSCRHIAFSQPLPLDLVRRADLVNSFGLFTQLTRFYSSNSNVSEKVVNPPNNLSKGLFGEGKVMQKIEINDQHSQRAIMTSMWCNFFLFLFKFAVCVASSSHVMFAEVVHSIADFANKALLAYILSISRRGPDDLSLYGYSGERFYWPFNGAAVILYLSSGVSISNGLHFLSAAHPPANMEYAALVIGGSLIVEVASLIVAIQAVKKGAAAEGMKVRDYIWRGRDPTSVAVMVVDGAVVTGLAIATASLVAVYVTSNPIFDPIGSIAVGSLLGTVGGFLNYRYGKTLLDGVLGEQDGQKIVHFLKNEPVVDILYDCKSEMTAPGFLRFKLEIDFNTEVLQKNILNLIDNKKWNEEFKELSKHKDDPVFEETMMSYFEEVHNAIGSEIDRLAKEIQKRVP